MFGFRFGGLLLGGIALVAGIGAAQASTVVPVPVPEPTVMSLIAAGAAGAAVLYRIRRKK